MGDLARAQAEGGGGGGGGGRGGGGGKFDKDADTDKGDYSESNYDEFGGYGGAVSGLIRSGR